MTGTKKTGAPPGRDQASWDSASWEARNLGWIAVHHPDLLQWLEKPAVPFVRVIPSRKGPPTLLAMSGEKEISLHSRMDPEKEAEDFALGLKADPEKILVILGMGLGYHVRAVLNRWPESSTVVVVESAPEFFSAAVRHGDLETILTRPKVELIVGQDPEAVQRRLTRLSTVQGLKDLDVRMHPPSARWRPEYYQQLAERLESSGSVNLRNRLAGARWRTERVRILFLDAGYFLSREIIRAAQVLGHEIRPIRVPDRYRGSEETIREILTGAAETKPDFLLTVNHLGFDAQGILAEVLTGLNLPWASWFVDSPRLILGTDRDPLKTGSIFLWDHAYAREISAMGYAHVHDLPLAADDALFHPPVGESGAEERDVAFVGDSMVGPVRKSLERLKPPRELLDVIDRAAWGFIGLPDRSPLGSPGGGRSPSSTPLSGGFRVKLRWNWKAW